MKETNIILPSSPEDRKRIKDAIKEISNSKLRIESENDYIKDTIAMLSEDFELPKPYMRKLATTYHKQNMTDQMGEVEDLEAFYDILFTTKQ